jgi:hypothetical protein
MGEIGTMMLRQIPPLPDKIETDAKIRSKFEDSFCQYLNQDWFSMNGIGDLVDGLALISVGAPDASFSFVLSSVPDSLIEESELPAKFWSRSGFMTYLSGFDWRIFYHRVIFQFAMDMLVSRFLASLLKNSRDMTSGSARSIFNQITARWFPAKNVPLLLTRLRLILGADMAFCFHVLSTVIPNELTSALFMRFPTSKSDLNTQFYLEVFQWIDMARNGELDLSAILSNMKALESFAKKWGPGTGVHRLIFAFCCNFFGNILTIQPSLRETQVVADICEVAREYAVKNCSQASIGFHGLMCAFCGCKKVKISLHDYCKRFIKTLFAGGLAGAHIECCLYFLRGCYASPKKLEYSGENFGWHNPDGRVLMKFITNKLMKQTESYADCQKELAELLLQMISSSLFLIRGLYFAVMPFNIALMTAIPPLSLPPTHTVEALEKSQ